MIMTKTGAPFLTQGLFLLLTIISTISRTSDAFVVTFESSSSLSSSSRGLSSLLQSTASSTTTDIIDETNVISFVTDQSSTSSLEVQTVNAMPEPLPLQLKNHYYLLRHGQSTANVASIISSDRASLAYTNKHGLTATGYEQGRASAAQFLSALQETMADEEGSAAEPLQVHFISSPFCRARQTAAACLEGLLEEQEKHKNQNDDNADEQQQDQSPLLNNLHIHTDITLNNGLCERYFGKLDAEAIYTYAYVWPLDKFNVTHTAFDVESVAAVCHRLRHTILEELEQQYTNAHLVLTSHADTLQIAQLYAAQADNVGEFSSFRFANGEVRRMRLGTTEDLPEPAPLEAPLRDTKDRLKEYKGI